MSQDTTERGLLRGLRQHGTTIVIAMLTAAVTAAAPAVAGSVVHWAQRAGHARTADHAKHAAQARHARRANGAKVAGHARGASKLNGYHAAQLARAAGTSHGSAAFVNTAIADDNAQGDLLTITAPHSGYLLTSLDFSCASIEGTGDTQWLVDLLVDGNAAVTVGGGQGSPMVLTFNHTSAGYLGDSAGIGGVVHVSKGPHTIGFNADRVDGNGTLNCDAYPTALFVPFGQTP